MAEVVSKMDSLGGIRTSRTSSFVKQQQSKLADQMSSSENWHESSSGVSELDKARYTGKRPPRPPPQPPLPSQPVLIDYEDRAAPSQEREPASQLSGFGKRPAKPPPGPPVQSQNSTESAETMCHVDKTGPPFPTDKTGQSFLTGKTGAPYPLDKVSGFGKRPARPPPSQPVPSQNPTGRPEVSPIGQFSHVEGSGLTTEAVKPRPVNHIEKVKLVRLMY